MSTKQLTINVGTTSIVLPADFDFTTATAYAAAASAGAGGDFTFGGPGPGGGALSLQTPLPSSWVPGALIACSVGAAGQSNDGLVGTAGGDTWIGGTSYATSVCAAKGGQPGANGNTALAAGGLGGAASAGIGSTKHSGGAGGKGGSTGNGGAGGGGGGAASSTADGVAGGSPGSATAGGKGGNSGGAVVGGAGATVSGHNGTNGLPGSTVPPLTGGSGGGGGTSLGGGTTTSSGGNGGFPGGAPGGGSNNQSSTGGLAANGVIYIVYTPKVVAPRKRRLASIIGRISVPAPTGIAAPLPTFTASTPTAAAASAAGAGKIVADTPQADNTRMFAQATAFNVVIQTTLTAADTLVWAIADHLGNVVAKGSTAVATGNRTLTIPCTSTMAGYFALTATLKTAGGAITTGGSGPAGMVTFGILPALPASLPAVTVPTIDRHRFGMQGFNDDIDHLTKLGISQTLDDREMLQMEPTAQNTFDPAVDSLDPFYKTNAIMRLIRLDGIPEYALPAGQTATGAWAPTDLTYFKGYMARVGTESEKVRAAFAPLQPKSFYQATWEPDAAWQDTDANFIALYNAIYTGLHSTDPHAFVMGPGCAFPTSTLSWLQRLQPLGLSNFLDGLTTHGYYDVGTSPSHPPERQYSDSDPANAANALPASLNNIRAYLQANYKPNMRLFMTELGISYDLGTAYGDGSYGPNVLFAHAAVIARAHIIILGEGADVTYPFYGADYPDEVGFGTFFVVDQPEGAFGAGNLSPKPAAMAIASMSAILDGTTTLGRVNNMTTTVFAYAFQRLGGGPVVTAVWTHSNDQWPIQAGGGFSQTYSVPYTLTVDAAGTTGTVTIIDMMGNTRTATYANGQLTLPIFEMPQYIVSTNATVAKANSTLPAGYTTPN